MVIGEKSPLHSQSGSECNRLLSPIHCGERDRISVIVNKATRPSRSAAEHHEAGVALASQGRFADAVKDYLEAARLNPKFSDTFYNLGVAYGELGQWKAAIKAYKEAIQLNPKDSQAYCNLGVDYVNSRQYAKAVDAFRRGAELNPGEVTLHVSVGYNCGRLRRYSEAIEAYSHALKLRPDFGGWYNIGLFHLHQRYYRDAVLAAERALAIDPDYDEPYVVIGMACRESGDLDGATKAFKRATEINPSFVEAHAHLGATYHSDLANIGRPHPKLTRQAPLRGTRLAVKT